MAEEIISAAPVVTAPAAEVSAPVVAPTAPVVETAPVITPVTETAPAEAPVVAPAETTLLTAEKVKPTEAKAAEAKTVETKPVEGEVKTVEAEKPVAPVFEAFKIPEGVTVDAEKIGEFTNALVEFETKTKASHEEVQAFGQNLIDRHIKGVEEAQTKLLEKLIDDGKKERESWKESFLKSPEFANRTDTVLNSAIDAINIYGGSKEQQQEFRDLMASTGVGNHPAMIRMLSNMMIAKPEPKQLAAPTIAKAVPKSQIEKRYGTKS
jgi:hypothetical protein